MPETPKGAKAPQDRKVSAAEKEQEQRREEDELLKDLPALTPAHELRLRTRNKILLISTKLNEFTGDGGAIELDASSPELVALLDVLADVDEIAESIAENSEEYVKWAAGASYEQFTALCSRYARAVGESAGSAS